MYTKGGPVQNGREEGCGFRLLSKRGAGGQRVTATPGVCLRLPSIEVNAVKGPCTVLLRQARAPSIQFIGSMQPVHLFGWRPSTPFHQIVNGVGVLGLQVRREALVTQVVHVFAAARFPHDEADGPELRDEEAEVPLIEARGVEELFQSELPSAQDVQNVHDVLSGSRVVRYQSRHVNEAHGIHST